MTCADFDELSGAYVLDALSSEERQAADEHLAHCPRCTQQIQELRAVVDLLPLSVPQVAPSPDLKQKVLSAIQSDTVRPAQSTRHIPPLQPVPSPQTLPVRRQTARRSWLMPLIAAAAIFLLLLSGGLAAWNVSLHQQIATLQANAITSTTYTIKGTSGTSQATGQVIYLPKLNMTVLVVHNLPRLQGTEVYQGWLIQGKQPTSIGLLNVQNGTATLDYPGSIQGYDAAAISREPGPTATPNTPKGQVVALGTLHRSASNT